MTEQAVPLPTAKAWWCARWVLPALLVLALVLRVAGIERKGLWTDEFKTLNAARLSVPELVRDRAMGGHFPTYFLAVKASRALFGESEAALRLPSVLAGVLLVWMVFQLARPAWGEGAAALAGLATALHPRAVWASVEARPYAFLMLAGGASLYALLRALETGRGGWWAAYAACTLAGLLCHVSYPFIWLTQVVVVVAWWLWCRRRGRPMPALGRGVGVTLGLLAITVPAYLWLKRHHVNDDFFEAAQWPRGEVCRDALLEVFFGQYKEILAPGWKYFCTPWAILTLWLAWRAARTVERRDDRRPPLSLLATAWAFALPLGLILLAGLVRSSTNGLRYFPGGIGGGALLIALAACAPMPAPWRRAFVAVWLLLLLTLGVGYQCLHGEELRRGVRFIAERRVANEPVVFCSGAGARIMAEYYHLGTDPLHVHRELDDPRQLTQFIQRKLAPLDTFWVLGYKSKLSPFHKLCGSLLSGTHRTEHRARFDQVLVYQMVRGTTISAKQVND
jgi:4-amino-4-deoxy-L-arabinose transferase-like glycosyltransferase